MPDDIEALLAGFEGEDEAPEPQEQVTQESSTIREMRAKLDQRDKALKKLAREKAELEAKEAQRVEESRKVTLAAAGLNEDQIAVFTKAYDEVTPESLDVFKTKVLGIPPATSEGTEPASPTPFVPTQAGGPPPAKVWTREEWDALYLRDPVAAHKVLVEGRIEGQRTKVTAGPDW